MSCPADSAPSQLLLIHHAGSSGIRATVASFTAAEDAKTGTTGMHIAVGRVGYDCRTGGVKLDKRMREILVDASKCQDREGRSGGQ